MRDYFGTEERVAALRAELERWRGTPFVAHTAICGVGVDCVRFAGAVLEACGAIGPVDWPDYAIRGVGKGWREMVEIRLMAAAQGTNYVPGGPESTGDLLILGGATGIVHVGLVGRPGRWWHAVPRYGVRESRLDDRNVMKHRLAAWRVMEVEA